MERKKNCVKHLKKEAKEVNETFFYRDIETYMSLNAKETEEKKKCVIQAFCSRKQLLLRYTTRKL